MAVKTITTLVKTFCHKLLNKFGHFLLPNTKNFTGKLISAGEKRVREEMKYSYPFSIRGTTKEREDIIRNQTYRHRYNFLPILIKCKRDK